MAGQRTVASDESGSLTIGKIRLADLREVLAKGYDDFTAMPSHAVFLCVVYPVLGLLIGRVLRGLPLLPMLYPLVAGFALIGPFAALGLYELSRRRELGLDTSVGRVFDVLRSPGLSGIAALGAMLLIIFISWLMTAQAVYYAAFDGMVPGSLAELFRQVLTTRAGWILAIAGNGLGFLFAVITFSLSVVSFPMVLDRHVDAAEAAATSLRAVAANPVTMAVWGLIIGTSLLLGSLFFFVGLIVVLPILGHASWHLYRKVVPH